MMTECTECHLAEGHRMDCSLRPASIFAGLLRDPRDVAAPAGSTNAELLALPQQREHTHDMQGRILLLPRTGLIVVPFDYRGRSWSCVVVDGSACTDIHGRERYPRGGHHIDVSDLEMQTAIELEPRGRKAAADIVTAFIDNDERHGYTPAEVPREIERRIASRP